MFRKEEATASRDKNVLSDFDRDGYIPDVDFGTDFYTNHDSPPLDSALIRFGEDLQEWSDDATDSDNDDMVGGRKEVQTNAFAWLANIARNCVFVWAWCCWS